MESTTICFRVFNGLDTLHGTVLSYSLGLNSPRGNELLFLGKDKQSDMIRLYRRKKKMEIPNDVLSATESTHFCIVLQAIEDNKVFSSIYVNGFIVDSSTEGETWDGYAVTGGGEVIIGQDQDCLLGCFNASQTFIGDLTEFAIYDTALTPDEVKDMAEDGSCGNHRPIITLEKESTMIFGVPEFKSGK